MKRMTSRMKQVSSFMKTIGTGVRTRNSASANTRAAATGTAQNGWDGKLCQRPHDRRPPFWRPLCFLVRFCRVSTNPSGYAKWRRRRPWPILWRVAFALGAGNIQPVKPNPRVQVHRVRLQRLLLHYLLGIGFVRGRECLRTRCNPLLGEQSPS
jgi:hypothetical protein